MKKIINLLLFVIIVGAFSECKKGENDPLLSTRTRKARVVGRWDVSEGKENSTYNYPGYSSSTNIVYTKNSFAANYSYTFNNMTTAGSDVGAFACSLELEKDGSYLYTQSMDGVFLISKGTWNFTGKVGDLKNKEQIVLFQTSSTQGSATISYTGNEVFKTFNILELRNKLMVLTSENSMYESNGQSEVSKVELTFEQ